MIKRRIIAALMTLFMVITLLPLDAFAYVGTKTDPPANEVKVGKETFQYGLRTFSSRYIMNDYIKTSLVNIGGKVSVITQPTRTATTLNKFLSKNIYSEESFKIKVSGKETQLVVSSATFETKSDCIITHYKFTDNRIAIDVTYKLVNLNEGYSEGHSNTGYTNDTSGFETIVSTPDDNPDDEGRTWGTLATMKCHLNTNDSLYLTWTRTYSRFNATGHANVSSGGSVKMSKTTRSVKGYDLRRPYTFRTDSVDISRGINMANACTSEDNGYYGINKDHHITEVYMDSYFWGNPFVATGCDFYQLKNNTTPTASAYIGVNGFTGDEYFPKYISYGIDDSLTVTSESKWLYKPDLNESDMPTMLDGFRVLYKKDEATEETVPPPDNIQLSADSNRLGVFKAGSGIAVYALDGGSTESTLKSKYGEPLAEIKGKFKENVQTDGVRSFSFQNGIAALSSTVTATWDETAVSGSNKPHFTIYDDGTIDMYMVNLNCPKFKFYSPKKNSLQITFTEDGVVFDINPKDNDSLIYIDIPHTECTVNKAIADTEGNLTFEGNLALKKIFGDSTLSMTRLGYGMKKGEFKVNGVEASGKISTASLVGLELAAIEGEINTFKDEERYAFSLELNVFDIFEGSASLELMRLKSGDLCPNSLHVAGYGEPGIPLIPPFIVARLLGGGGGFDNLAKTINGEFIAIPPITISMETGVSLLHIFEGQAHTTIGPSKVSASLKDISLSKLPDLISEINYNIGLMGEKKTYLGNTYTGVNASGGMYIAMRVPEDLEVFCVDGGFRISGFAGLDSYSDPTRVHMDIKAMASLSGDVKFPKNWAIIGGKSVASAKVAAAIGGKTAIKVKNVSFKDAAKSAFNNLKIYGGLAYTGNIGEIHYRVHYIIPKDIGFKVKWGEMDDWDFDEIAGIASIPLYDEDGATAGMAIVEFLTDEAEYTKSNVQNVLSATPTDSTGFATLSSDPVTATYTLDNVSSISDDTAIMLRLYPTNGASADDMAKELVVTDGSNNPVTLNWLPDEIDESKDSGKNYNATIGLDNNKRECIFISLGTKADLAGTSYSWTVNSMTGSFDGNILTQEPAAAISASGSTSADGYTVTAKVASPDKNRKYRLGTYIGKQPGDADYIVDERELTSTPSTITVPATGEMAPTGTYYVSLYLEQEMVGDFDGDGTEETVYVPVDNMSLTDAIAYKNLSQPDAPASMTITATGNEIMNAKWKRVAGADGYKLTIYEVDSQGNAIDTGKGYDVKAEDAATISDFSYIAPSNEYSMDMALTVGGTDINGVSTALEADKTYVVGVQAYKYLATTAEGEGQAPVYSEETRSAEQFLSKYKELDLTIKSRSDSFSPYETLTPDPESGVYNIVTNKYGFAYISVSADNAGNADIEYSVTRMDNGDKFIESSASFDIPGDSYTGSIMVKVSAKNKATGDVSSRYVNIQKDETAPILALDKNNVLANASTGKYTITGYTEPGATVTIAQTSATAVAGDDGKFTITGKLAKNQIYDEESGLMVETEGFETLIADLSAKDNKNNESSPVMAVISTKAAAVNAGTVLYDLMGGSWESGYTAPGLYSAADPITFPTASKLVRKGYTFAGWYDNDSYTGEALTSTTASQSGQIVLYAKWKKNASDDPDPTTEETTTEETTTQTTTQTTTETTTETTTDDPTETTADDPTETTADDPTETTTDDPTESTTGAPSGGDNPGTGDPFMPILWMILLVLCGSGAVILVEKKNNKE